MHTSVLLLALLGPDAAPFAADPDNPTWQDSYRAAREAGREQSKPLAVFIASGPSGWESLTDDGKPTRQARRLLAAHFVCLYVDRSTPEGRRLAEAFEVAGGTGLVVSTRDGEGQAFAYNGKMSRAELEETLRRYGNGKEVRRTETLDRARYTYVSYYDGSLRSETAGQTSPTTTSRPAYYYAPPATYAAPMSYGSFGGGFRGGFSGGGC